MLDAMTRQRLVKALGSGRTQLYELNTGHPLAPAMAALFRAEHQRWDGLMGAIRDVLERHGNVAAAWLYGSVARGEDAPDSDVDIALLVRSQAVADEVREALMPLEDAQQIRISLTALTPRELAALPEDDAWWANVAREGRVLKGAAPDEARRRVARAAACRARVHARWSTAAMRRPGCCRLGSSTNPREASSRWRRPRATTALSR